VVIGLALLLGWMVGRAGWEMALSSAKTKAEPIQAEVSRASETPPNNAPVIPAPSRHEKKDAGSSEARAVGPTNPKQAEAPPKKPEDSAAVPPGGLVVSQNGKVIFEMLPGKSKGKQSQSAGATEPSAVAGGGEGKPVSLSPDAANAYLLQRVEPQYPEEAKQQHIQGSVVLNAVVGADGTVRGLNPISGDPGLIPAAIQAVQQWRYKPYSVNGAPVEFETTVTVSFALPQGNN
jgi:TonB family protein